MTAKKESIKRRCTRSHVPNAETVEALDASERGEGLMSFDSIDDFFRSMECSGLQFCKTGSTFARTQKNYRMTRMVKIDRMVLRSQRRKGT
jgi:hypothetical protein